MFLLAEILTAVELARRLRIQTHMEKLPELEGVDASLELMEQHPKINRDAGRYDSEVQSLVDRHELITMREVLTQTMLELSKTDDPDIRKLIERGKDLRTRIEKENTDLHWYFPITDYLRRSTVDPEGVLRVFYHQLNQARADGMKSEGMSLGKFSKLFSPRKDAPKLADVEPLKGNDPETEALRNELAKFAETLKQETEAIRKAGHYAMHQKNVADLGREYEEWLRKVAQ